MASVAPPGTAPAPGKKSPAAMDLSDLAKLLAASGARHANSETVRTDIDAGAPTNADGTINLVHYAAWLVRQVAAQESSGGGGGSGGGGRGN